MQYLDEGQQYQPRRAVYLPPPPGQPWQPQQPPQQPPVGGQIPGQGIYLQQQAQAEQAYQASLADIAHRKSNTIRDYGFNADGTVDAHNNYGQIQNMWRGQGQQTDASNLGLLGRGIKGGLANQAHTALNTMIGGQNLDLSNHYNTDMYNYGQEALGAEATKNAAILSAQQQAEQTAQQNSDYTPAAAPPDAPPDTPARRQARQHAVRQAAQRAARRRRGRRH